MTGRSQHERFEILLMKATDGVISAEEEHALQVHMQGCDGCKEEHEAFSEMKEMTDSMRERIMADARIESHGSNGRRAWFLGSAFVLLLVGLTALIGFAGYVFVLDPAVSRFVKVAVGCLGLGALALFCYALFVRLRALGRDPYEDVDL